MGDYYAIVRSTDHLMHYGVKGMKWGVRKAIDSGNQKKLEKQYKKAKRKLEKLNSKADIDIQKIASNRHAIKALAGFGIGGYAANVLHNRYKNAKARVDHVYDTLYGYSNSNGLVPYTVRQKKIVGKGKGIYKVGEGLGTRPVGDGSGSGLKAAVSGGGLDPNSIPKKITKRDIAAIIDAGTAIAGLGATAYHTGKSIAARYRTTGRGHAKAVAKRDAWQKEMNKAFKGTKFGSRKNQNRRG